MKHFKHVLALTVMVGLSALIAFHAVYANGAEKQVTVQTKDLKISSYQVSYPAKTREKLSFTKQEVIPEFTRKAPEKQEFSKLTERWKRGVDKQIAQMKRYDRHLRTSANRNEVSYDLLVAFGVTESGGVAKATSRTNVKGLMQVTQRTFSVVGMKGADRTNPANSIEASARYFNELKKEGCTTHELQAVGYNAGCSKAKTLSSEELKQTEYVQKINYVLEQMG